MRCGQREAARRNLGKVTEYLQAVSLNLSERRRRRRPTHHTLPVSSQINPYNFPPAPFNFRCDVHVLYSCAVKTSS